MIRHSKKRALLFVLASLGCSSTGTKQPHGSPDAGNGNGGIPSFAVGVTTRTFVDTTRETPANGNAPAKKSRTLDTTIWYPTVGDTSSSKPTTDATLAPNGPFPLVFFVHGSSSGRGFYTYLTQGLASAGYVVVAADFPLTSIATAGGASDVDVSAQVGDLSFLCDQLAATASKQGDTLRGAVDGAHYAVVGHSTGGAVAELAAFAGDDAAIKHDPRVSAIVPISGDACMFRADFFKSRSVPVFVVGGTGDLFVPPANNGQWVFDNTNPPHLFAKLVGASHVRFTDYDLPDDHLHPQPTGPTSTLAKTLSAYGDAAECLPVPPAGNDASMPVAQQHELAERLIAAYLEGMMRNNLAPLAAAIAEKDPLIVFQQ
jgi:predicted dienelactone hydrolase